MTRSLIHKKKQLVPELRFEEFDSEWTNKTLGEVSIFLDGRRKPIKSVDRSKMQGKYPYYGASGIIDYVNDYIFDEEVILLGEDGENIVSRNLPLAFRVSGKCWINNHAHVIRPNEDTDIDFLTINLERTNYEIYNTGTAQPKLNQEVCRNIPSFFPPLPEQQKIASFLSSIDQKIQQLTRKKELLEQYKKGVMQQLFSGKVRFKDENGKTYPKWQKKTLGDVGKIVSGLTYNPLEVHADGILVLRSSNVKNRRFTFEDNVYVRVSVGNFNPVEENDILICVRNGSKNLIGKNALVTKKESGMAFGAFMSVYRSNSNNFVFHFFDTDYYKNEVHKNLGATINSINGSDLIKLKIPFPCRDEQNKIANFLSRFDMKINLLLSQINQMQTFKQGLLQQMFV